MTTPLRPAIPFAWDDLGRYKAAGKLPDGYPDWARTFWSPVDDVHGLLTALLSAAQHSVAINMYGWDDPDLDAILRSKMTDEHVYVQMSLDKTQAGGVHEKELLAQWPHDAFGTSIAVGTSSKHAISHLKICIVDGLYTVRGSTNWSLSGEQRQDNELTLLRDAVVAAETRSVLDRNHDWMLKQMVAAGATAPQP